MHPEISPVNTFKVPSGAIERPCTFYTWIDHEAQIGQATDDTGIACGIVGRGQSVYDAVGDFCRQMQDRNYTPSET